MRVAARSWSFNKRPLEGIGPDDLQVVMTRTGETLGAGTTAVIRTGHDRITA
jgi:hypothetical protein